MVGVELTADWAHLDLWPLSGKSGSQGRPLRRLSGAVSDFKRSTANWWQGAGCLRTWTLTLKNFKPYMTHVPLINLYMMRYDVICCVIPAIPSSQSWLVSSRQEGSKNPERSEP